MPVFPALPIKQRARQLGFDLCRIIQVAEAPRIDHFKAWLAHGCAGEMTYLERNIDKRRQPSRLAAANQGRFRSMLVLAVDYHQVDLPSDVLSDPSRGVIAAYARGLDYHDLIRPRLHDLDAFIASQSGRSTPGKCLVDSGPVLERDWAQLAGVGFSGKNCCTIHPRLGSWLLLATVMVPEEITPDNPQPLETIYLDPSQLMAGLPREGDYGRWQIPAGNEGDDRTDEGTCGKCFRCLSACPTDAFIGPYVLEPRRCISYWTIEAKGIIPRELRPLFGNRIFGCDVCQDVCPWNKRLKPHKPVIPGLEARAERSAPPLLDGFEPDHPYWMDERAFNARFEQTPLLRAGQKGMLRNVCVALGNWADPQALPGLKKALVVPEPVVRAHAAWAVGQLLRKNRGEAGAAGLLRARLDVETDTGVTEEIRLALG